MVVLHLDHVAVPTWDLERAERFYQAAFGLRRHATPAYVPGQVVFLDLGNARLDLMHRDLARRAAGSAPLAAADLDAFLAVQAQTRNLWAHLALQVEDLEGALERVVAAGGTVVRGAALRPDGQTRGAFICDTEQNLIALVQG